MSSETPVARMDSREKERRNRVREGSKWNAFLVLYLAVALVSVLLLCFLYWFKYKPNESKTLFDLIENVAGNLLGVLLAFLVFDCFHRKISKDAYASEVSEQLLDTLMGHPEVIRKYEDAQKKNFVRTIVESTAVDPDAAEMIQSHLNGFLLTKNDFANEKKTVSPRDCRIRPEFSYHFVLDTVRSESFKELAPLEEDARDPYFYVQEVLHYKVRYLDPKGKNLKSKTVSMALVYDWQTLDKYLRENPHGCIFREYLDIEDADKNLFRQAKNNPSELLRLVQEMFRPCLVIDGKKGELKDVSVVPESTTANQPLKNRDCGLLLSFEVDHDPAAMEHDIHIVFHEPKKWNDVLEVVLVEPTKAPKIWLSYEEDKMSVEMFPFLGKGDGSSYDNAHEPKNGVYGISIADEWVFPRSGVAFLVKRKTSPKALPTEP